VSALSVCLVIKYVTFCSLYAVDIVEFPVMILACYNITLLLLAVCAEHIYQYLNDLGMGADF